MSVTDVSIEFRKTVSDREYGNETVAIRLNMQIDEGMDYRLRAAALLDDARALAMEQLGQSESLNLRRAIHPRPRLCNYCHQPLADDDRMYMHVECDEKMQAERSAQRAETRDLEEMPF